MDDSEFNLEHFAKLFDAALTSDNPSVKKALRNFMMVASLVEANNSDDNPEGPFHRLLERLDSLDQKVTYLQQQIIQQETQADMLRKYKEQYKQYTTGWPSSYTDTIKYTTDANTWKSSYINDYDINDLMKRLGKGSV